MTASTPVRVRIENLFKVFGRKPEVALQLWQEGKAPQEIREETGSVIAVSGVSMWVREAEIFVIVGLSGSGKSTLVRCINRLIPATQGQIWVDGEDVMAMTASQLQHLRRTKVAMVFQRFSLFPHKTVIGNVEYGLKVQGIPRQQRHDQAMQVLATVGLDDWAKALPHELSGGMQQRVGLARALATNPDILLMDEAFGALDPLIKGQMQEELLRLHSSLRKTIIFITHDIQEAVKLGDRIAVMRRGEFVQVGEAEDLLIHPADAYVKTFMKDINRIQVLRLGAVPLRSLPSVLAGDPISSALKCLQVYQSRCLCVVDEEGHALGLVTEAPLIHAAQKGYKTVKQAIQTDTTQACTTTKIKDVIPQLHTDLPITVLDPQGHYLGLADLEAMLHLTGSPQEDINSDSGCLSLMSKGRL